MRRWSAGRVSRRGLVAPVVIVAMSILPTAPSLAALPATSGNLLWANRVDHQDDLGAFIVVSPDGTRVYAAGETDEFNDNGTKVLVSAHDAATGDTAWSVVVVPVPGDLHAHTVTGIAVAPDSSAVYVTGTVDLGGNEFEMYLTALATNDGHVLWTARWGRVDRVDESHGVAVSADGSMVIITGKAERSGNFVYDWATVAYRADTGAKAWVQIGPGAGGGTGNALVSAGDTVYVTGAAGSTLTTIAYRVSSGKKEWVSRGGGGGSDGSGAAIAVSGPNVIVAGTVAGDGGAALASYDAATGALNWSARSGGTGLDDAQSVAVSEDGSRAYAAGTTRYGYRDRKVDFLVMAVDAGTGSVAWVSRWDGTGSHDDIGQYAAAVSADGSRLFVSGTSRGGKETGDDIATVAFDTSNGAQAWADRFTGDRTNGYDAPNGLVLSADGSVVYVGGTVQGNNQTRSDALLLAYST